MLELLKKTNIDFIGKKYITLLVTGALTIIGLIAIIQIATGKANMGIDFAGGTSIQLRFEKPVALQSVRSALESGGIKGFELQDIPAENKVIIKTKQSEGDLTKISDSITAAMSQTLSGNKYVIDSTTAIGPKVGTKLRNDAVKAIIMAAIGILIYVAFRFKFQFGVGATIATFHDVLAVLGIFYLMGKEINLIVVSGLLTIAGYSLTDTVVVFDRIRENLKKQFKEPLPNVINNSINEVLSRTIITSFTTFMAAAALFFLGGEVIHDFAFAIMLGIIIGTYSSIFVASPILLLWKKNRPFEKK
ncbi:MAG: protein translocase subunit SecF [Nitrospira bacterium HGW-Nitrospira-1]|nr:MAG: protein translocase subunit SecF [Nitrospira bacterium HGW-Nitrospira-1]